MADQDYPNLYADMEASARRTRDAAIAFEHVLGGPEADMVPVNGYPAQPTIAGRVKQRIDPLVATLDAAAESVKRFAGVHPVAPTTRYDGSALQPGDEYQNSTSKLRYSWDGTAWVVLNASVQQLTQQIASATGSNMVGYGTTTAGAQLDVLTARTDPVLWVSMLRWKNRPVEKQLASVRNVGAFGAVGDNVTAETAFIQNAIIDAYNGGGGTVTFDASAKGYYIPGTVITLPGVHIDLCGAVLRGNRNGGTADMFVTGTMVNGVPTSNLGSAAETKLVMNMSIRNGKIIDAYRAIHFRNAIMGCSIQDIVFENCRQSWNLERCFYIYLKQIISRIGSLETVPTYQFTEAYNAIVMERVTAGTEYGFAFLGGGAAMVMMGCTFEGGKLGMYFQGENHCMAFIGNYFEAVPGKLFNLEDCTSFSGTWSANYFNFVDVILAEPVNGYMSGTWDESNVMVNVGVTLEGFLYRGLIYMQKPLNGLKMRLPPNYNGSASLPANIVVGTSLQADVQLTSVRWATGPGDVLSKALVQTGVMPRKFSGDTGRTYPNQVTFASHQAATPGASAITILIDTQIKWRADTCRGSYRFVVTDTNSSYTLFGDFWGSSVKAADTTGKGVLLSEGPTGNLRLALSGFTHPSGSYTCTGEAYLLG